MGLTTAVGLVALLGGCGILGGGAPADELVQPDTVAEPEPAEPEPLPAALPVEGGDYATATARLAHLASQCDEGERGRQALLLRALMELDPRNPGGVPDTAAHLAARYLQLPDAEPAGIYMAETIYLLALDRGASAVSEPWAYPSVAPRFSDCGQPGPLPKPLRELPAHPGTPASRALTETWRALRIARDQVDALQAELERIRKLLGRPDR